MTDAYREASKYETARKRELRRHHEAKDRERENHLERMKALRAALSPAAARIVVAAESEAEPHPPLVMPMKEAMASGAWPTGDPSPDPDPGYPPQAWLNQEPAPLPAGSVVIAEEGKKARRA